MKTLTIQVPDSLSVSDAQLALAVGLWLEGTLSQSQAADLAGMEKRAFIDELSRRRLPFTNIGPEDFDKELATWRARSSSTRLP